MPRSDPATVVPYLETCGFEWTERAFTLLTEDRLTATARLTDGVLSVVVAGPCPRCAHHLVDRQVATAVAGVGSGAVRHFGIPRPAPDTGPPTVQMDVTCGCGNAHPGAPDTVTGCGVSFRIELVADEDQP